MRPIQTYYTIMSEFGEFINLHWPQATRSWFLKKAVFLFFFPPVRNETMELEENVTKTSLIVTLDAESYYNASVSTWTNLGDGGLRSYISFTTADTGAGGKTFDACKMIT